MSDYINNVEHLMVMGTCPNCHNAMVPGEGGYFNAYQIIRLYGFYELNPAGLLLLPASSSSQQQFFELVYAQITESTPNEVYIPSVLQFAFRLQSVADYNVLRSDPSFLFKSIRFCESCYDSVRKMLVSQSDEHLRSKSFGRVSYLSQQPDNTLSQQSMERKLTPRRLMPIDLTVSAESVE